MGLYFSLCCSHLSGCCWGGKLFFFFAIYILHDTIWLYILKVWLIGLDIWMLTIAATVIQIVLLKMGSEEDGKVSFSTNIRLKLGTRPFEEAEEGTRWWSWRVRQPNCLDQMLSRCKTFILHQPGDHHWSVVVMLSYLYTWGSIHRTETIL